jgi:hypothetical protein
LGILETFLDLNQWEVPRKLERSICESSLLPLIEAAFRSGSLLEMSKEQDLIYSYLRLVKVVARHPGLVPCLLQLDKHYRPTQTESILTLLSTLKDTAKIFLNCVLGNNE